MPYKVIDKKTQTAGAHWTLYNGASEFENAIVPLIDIDPIDLLNQLDDLNPGIVTINDKISLLDTLLSSIKEFNSDDQSLTRTRVFENKEVYDRYISLLSGVDLESLKPAFYPLKYTEEIISATEV